MSFAFYIPIEDFFLPLCFYLRQELSSAFFMFVESTAEALSNRWDLASPCVDYKKENEIFFCSGVPHYVDRIPPRVRNKFPEKNKNTQIFFFTLFQRQVDIIGNGVWLNPSYPFQYVHSIE